MNSKSATVYVVDDDADIRTALQRSLSRRDFNVESYSNANDFLSDYKPGSPGCLVLDVRMPGMSGPELQARLNELNIILPVIFITGHGDIPMSVRAIKDGAMDFLEKPYPVEDLTQLIDQAFVKCAEMQDQQDEIDSIRANYTLLTSREQEVMVLLVAGAATSSNKLIAKQLGISHRTVDDHRAKIMAKMRAKSISDLVEKAKCCGSYTP